MAAPIALFASCSKTKPEDLIKDIIQENITQGSPVIEDIVAYPWLIDTRYYTARVDLCSTKSRTIGNAEFAQKLEAFIVHFNSKEKESFDSVKLWLPYLKEIEPDIRLLICDTCSDGDAVSREDAWKWCLENSFELVELDPEIEEHSDEEDDFQETTGIKRIIQALHAHSWPNLEMKDKPSFRSSLMTQMMRDAKLTEDTEGHTDKVDSETCDGNAEENTLSEFHNRDKKNCDISDLTNPFLDHLIQNEPKSVDSNISGAEGFSDNFEPDSTVLKTNENKGQMSSDSASKETTKVKEDTSVTSSQKSKSDSKPADKDSVLESMLATLGTEGSDPEAFEDLFDKLKTMKEQAEHLPFDQRKQYAEKVAIQFWKAIGGDEDEIEGLSSEEEQ